MLVSHLGIGFHKVEVYDEYSRITDGVQREQYQTYREVLGPDGESYADKDYPYHGESSWFGQLGRGGPTGNFTRLRITIYKASTQSKRDSSQGRIGISEIFFIHPEVARPYTGFLPKTMFEGAAFSGTSTTKTGIGTSDPQALVDISNPDFGSDSQAVDENISRNYPLRISNQEWLSNQVTGIEFWNASKNKSVPTSRIVSKMDGDGAGGEVMKFQTQPSSSSNPSPNQPTTKLELGSNGENKFFGQLLINGGNAFTTPVQHTFTTGTKTIDFAQSNVYILTMPSGLGSNPTLDALDASISGSAGHTFTILLKNNSTRNLLYSADFQWIGEVPTHSTSGTDIISGVCDGSKYFLTLVKDKPDLPSFTTVRNIKTISSNAQSEHNGGTAGVVYDALSGNFTVNRANSDMVFSLTLHIGNIYTTQYAAINIEYQWNGTGGTWTNIPLTTTGVSFPALSANGHNDNNNTQIAPIVVTPLLQDVGASSAGDVFYWRVKVMTSDGNIKINQNEVDSIRTASWITVEENYTE